MPYQIIEISAYKNAASIMEVLSPKLVNYMLAFN